MQPHILTSCINPTPETLRCSIWEQQRLVGGLPSSERGLMAGYSMVGTSV